MGQTLQLIPIKDAKAKLYWSQYRADHPGGLVGLYTVLLHILDLHTHINIESTGLLPYQVTGVRVQYSSPLCLFRDR